jgi:hypothetical protein
MSISSRIASIFRPVTAVVMPTQNNNAALPEAGESNKVLNTANEAPNPMDALAALMQNDPAVKPPVDPLAAPLLQTDVTKLRQAAGNMNLVGTIDPELMTKAMSGQDPAAFAAVLNTVAQNAVVTSAQLSAATDEQATTRNNQRMLEVIPNKIKQAQIDSGVAENPALAHPAAQPFLHMVRSQIQMKNPGLSPAEINRQAETVIAGFAESVTAAPQEAVRQQAASQGTDWDKWAGI